MFLSVPIPNQNLSRVQERVARLLRRFKLKKEGLMLYSLQCCILPEASPKATLFSFVFSIHDFDEVVAFGFEWLHLVFAPVN